MSLLRISGALAEVASPAMTWEPRLCSRTCFPRSRCENCIQTCPEGALAWERTLRLAEGGCTGCGICISTCPNGAFWDRNGGDAALVRHGDHILARSQSKVFKFACSRCDATEEATLHLCCLSRLTESVLLAPLLRGAARVEIYKPDCQGCRYERSLAHLEATIRLGKALARMTGLESDSIVECAARLRYELESGSTLHATARRDFLRQAGQAALRAAVAFLPETAKSDEAAHTVNPKRALLLQMLRSHTTQPAVRTDGLRVAGIQINDDCTGCPVCSRLCPAGALERVESDRQVSISFRPWLCTGCGVCWEACLFHAISLSPELTAEHLREGNSRLLCALSRVVCQECGESSWGVHRNLCGICRIRRRMAQGDRDASLAGWREQQ